MYGFNSQIKVKYLWKQSPSIFFFMNFSKNRPHYFKFKSQNHSKGSTIVIVMSTNFPSLLKCYCYCLKEDKGIPRALLCMLN